MIIPKLYGRLGNQCFQVAAAIAHARKMETTWAIPRNTENIHYWPNYFLKQVPRNNITVYNTRDYYTELRHCFDPLPTNQDLTINGYFQSEKYFEQTKEEVRIALGFKDDWGTQAYGDYVAIHVRRGDYVTQFSDKHPPLDIDYYTNAIVFFLRQGFSKFRVYSDDISWAVKNITPKLAEGCALKDAMLIDFSQKKDPLTDMRDMYNASGFIIANSTFSLFPALLRSDNPPVVAPAESRWFGPGNSHLPTVDLMPERFIKL